MFPHTHKTVVVLDHSPYFASPTGETIEIDAIKSKIQPGDVLVKSLWTSSIEAMLEYHRIVTDLFPAERLIRLVVSDSVGRVITENWSEECMTLEKILASCSSVGAPDPLGDQANCCILNGLAIAVEALTRCSVKQTEMLRARHHVLNRGRIVVVTHLKQKEEISMIEDRVIELITDQNKLASSLDENFLPITNVQLCLINTYTNVEEDTTLENKPMTVISDMLSSEFLSCPSGKALTLKMHVLVQKHYNLSSTTVSGIPMKEEQNSAGSSANYDVELLHPKEVHDELEKTGLGAESGLLAKREGYNTFMLKWCTPAAKTGASDQIYATTTAERCSPVEINSRPSACLTSFLLSGRTVTLELPKKLATKVTSHMLTCHGGHIYIHSLSLGKMPFDEPPAISDCPGGRLTDYRIAQFTDFMKEALLQPNDGSTSSLAKAKQHLQSLSSFWPMTINETVVFSMSQRFEPLISLIKKTQLTDSDVSECKNVILHVLTMENSHDPLTSVSQCSKLKGVKREDQYNVVWNELELYLRNYSHYSPTHHSILNCLLQCTNRPVEPYVKMKDSEPATISFAGRRSSTDISIDKLENGNPAREHLDAKRARLIEPMEVDNIIQGTVNLLGLVNARYEEKTSNWRDFDGRVASTGNTADLYPNLGRRLEEDGRKGPPFATDKGSK